ncbi:hypothetical protein EDD17DRAFT_603868 [Pisolithus thermaeus]|nr:hypothetical protein EDD17DRAFT_603868 [Pisolithus thermaeus]
MLLPTLVSCIQPTRKFQCLCRWSVYWKVLHLRPSSTVTRRKGGSGVVSLAVRILRYEFSGVSTFLAIFHSPDLSCRPLTEFQIEVLILRVSNPVYIVPFTSTPNFSGGLAMFGIACCVLVLARGVVHSLLDVPSPPFEAYCAVLILVTFARIFAEYVPPNLAASTSVPDPPVASSSAGVTVLPLPGNYLRLADTEGSEDCTFVPIAPSYGRNQLFGDASVTHAPSISSYMSSLDVLVSTLCSPRSSYRRVSHSIPLVEHDPSTPFPPSFSGGVDTHT